MITPLATLAGATAPDSLRRALDEVFARPEYRWDDSRFVASWLFSLWRRFLDWLDALRRAHPTQYTALIVVLTVILIAILVHLAYVTWRITRPTVRAGPASAGPGPPMDDERTHLRRAAELAAVGRYAEALAHRFVALLLRLEGQQAVQCHPAKTPAEYVLEARLDADGRAGLSALVQRLYHHLFGAAPCDARGYEEFGMLAARVGEHVAPR